MRQNILSLYDRERLSKGNSQYWIESLGQLLKDLDPKPNKFKRFDEDGSWLLCWLQIGGPFKKNLIFSIFTQCQNMK